MLPPAVLRLIHGPPHRDEAPPVTPCCTNLTGTEGRVGVPHGAWGRPPVALIGAFPPPLGGQAIYNQRLLEEVRARGIAVTAVDLASRSTHGTSPLTRMKLARLLMFTRFSILHLTASDSRIIGFEVIVAMASALRGTPFVYNILAGRFAARVAEYAVLQRLLLCCALRRASRILVSNHDMASALSRLPFLGHAAVEVIGCRLPLGIEPEEDPEIVQFLEGGNPAIVAVGAMRMVYGFDLLVRACTILSARGLRPRLLLIVSGTAEPTAHLALDQALHEAGGLWPMSVHHDLPRARVLGAIRAATVLVRPTRADGDSLSIHEARALGVPVVASDSAPRPPGVVLHRHDDPGSVAEAILLASRIPRESATDDGTLVDRVVACYESLCRK